jgi:hypothetical protein
MASGLALSIGPLQVGTPVLLEPIDSTDVHQQWKIDTAGLLHPVAAPGLAITVDTSQTPARLVLDIANPATAGQVFTTLSNGQFLWSGVAPHVLSGVGGGAYKLAGVRPKTDAAPEQLWYTAGSALICEINALALTVTGTAATGARLRLDRYIPKSAAQGFTFDGERLVHSASGLPVVVNGQDVVLGSATDNGPHSRWSLAPAMISMPIIHGVGKRALDQKTNEYINYQVTVVTGDFLGAGTDDKVEIALVGDRATTDYVELKQSETHRDPFERGQTDRFSVTLRNVGNVTAVNIRYGANVWFFRDEWVLEALIVYDPSTLTTYRVIIRPVILLGASEIEEIYTWRYKVPAQTTLYTGRGCVGNASGTMSVSTAPTQDWTNGWLDHTWVTVSDSDRVTYFDCAGGHGGPGTVGPLISGACDLNTAVKMATGFNIDSDHPYQSVYGNNDVTAVATCGLRASGRRNWDGQCQQIANRHLWACSPPVSLSDVPWSQQPRGWGLGWLAFGPYGLGFEDWCRKVGVSPPANYGVQAWNLVRKVCDTFEEAQKIYYRAISLSAATGVDAEGPTGTAVKAFFAGLKEDGVPNATVAKVVNLTENQVAEEQKTDL